MCNRMLSFMADVPTKRSKALEGRSFSIPLVKVNDQQEIGQQTGKQLEQNAVLVAGDEVINLQMPFPPGKEGFDCSQVFPVGDDPICFPAASEAHQKYRMGHLMGFTAQ